MGRATAGRKGATIGQGEGGRSRLLESVAQGGKALGVTRATMVHKVVALAVRRVAHWKGNERQRLHCPEPGWGSKRGAGQQGVRGVMDSPMDGYNGRRLGA